MRPHILQGLNPKPRRSLRRNKGSINFLTEWSYNPIELQEPRLFTRKLSIKKPASFLMLNGVLCCLCLSLVDALFVVGMPGKHTMGLQFEDTDSGAFDDIVASFFFWTYEQLVQFSNGHGQRPRIALWRKLIPCVQVFCALVYVKVSEFKALSMFGNQQCHGMSDEQFWKTEYVVDWMSIGILPIRLILFLEMMVFFSMTFFFGILVCSLLFGWIG